MPIGSIRFEQSCTKSLFVDEGVRAVVEVADESWSASLDFSVGKSIAGFNTTDGAKQGRNEGNVASSADFLHEAGGERSGFLFSERDVSTERDNLEEVEAGVDADGLAGGDTWKNVNVTAR